MQMQARKPRCSCLNMNLEECCESCQTPSMQGSPEPDTQFCDSTNFRGASLIFPSRGKDSSNHRIDEDCLDTSGRVEVQLSLGTIQVSDTSGVTPLPALMIYTAKLGIVLKCSYWSPMSIN